MFHDIRVPMLLLGMSAALLAAASLWLWLPPATWGRLQQRMRTLSRTSGVVLGLGIAMLVVIMTQNLASPMMRGVGLAGAGCALALFGFYLPGMEARRHAARRQRLAWQTIDFAGYLMFAMTSSAGEASMLREYVRVPRSAVRDIQQVIAEALEAHERAGRGNLWDRLHENAQTTGSEPLMELTRTLVEVTQHDRRHALDAQALQRRQRIERVIAAVKERAQYLEWATMGVTALALFLGLIPFMLYVMTGGFRILAHLW